MAPLWRGRTSLACIGRGHLGRWSCDCGRMTVQGLSSCAQSKASQLPHGARSLCAQLDQGMALAADPGLRSPAVAASPLLPNRTGVCDDRATRILESLAARPVDRGRRQRVDGHRHDPHARGRLRAPHDGRAAARRRAGRLQRDRARRAADGQARQPGPHGLAGGAGRRPPARRQALAAALSDHARRGARRRAREGAGGGADRIDGARLRRSGRAVGHRARHARARGRAGRARQPRHDASSSTTSSPTCATSTASPAGCCA